VLDRQGQFYNAFELTGDEYLSEAFASAAIILSLLFQLFLLRNDTVVAISTSFCCFHKLIMRVFTTLAVPKYVSIIL